MLEAKERSEWSRMSNLLHLVASAFAPKGKKYKFADFDPFAEQDSKTITPTQLGAMLGIKEGAGKP